VIEFTGERVIPGQVNDDLWAEHTARYAFALRYAHGGRALDIGCGTGYGLAEIAANVERAIGIDAATEAVAYARGHYPAATFLQASAESLPFADSAFDLITAFEVIEHLDNWRDLLREARRLIQPGGVFLVSTPNKLYYAESRAGQGPNPFHTHEFTFDEFRDELTEFFPNLDLFLQNRQECFAFVPATPSDTSPDAHLNDRAAAPDEANFFLAVCSRECASNPRPFLYVPKAANLLREREHHIHLLQKNLKQTIADHKTLQDEHVDQTRHLEQQNRWARDLDTRWHSAMHRITQLQDELQRAQATAAEVIAGLEQENRAKTQWALDTEARLTGELAHKSTQLAEAVRLLDQAESTVVERTLWAQDLQKRVDALQAQLAMVRESRWVKLGRAVGLGPQVQD
jgi:SAM-dependent methyltransferase